MDRLAPPLGLFPERGGLFDNRSPARYPDACLSWTIGFQGDVRRKESRDEMDCMRGVVVGSDGDDGRGSHRSGTWWRSWRPWRWSRRWPRRRPRRRRVRWPWRRIRRRLVVGTFSRRPIGRRPFSQFKHARWNHSFQRPDGRDDGNVHGRCDAIQHAGRTGRCDALQRDQRAGRTGWRDRSVVAAGRPTWSRSASGAGTTSRTGTASRAGSASRARAMVGPVVGLVAIADRHV